MRDCECYQCTCAYVCAFFYANGVVIVGEAVGVCAGTRLILILVLLRMFGHPCFHLLGVLMLFSLFVLLTVLIFEAQFWFWFWYLCLFNMIISIYYNNKCKR